MESLKEANMTTANIDKWFWMMDWCAKMGLPPADRAIWEIAEKKYNAYAQVVQIKSEESNA